ncbi:hypothetical protein EDC04DRAFT_2923181 [Pisolithus marmoratus]|nr:hypothetical protein EDC04DRAFT_2923181 [Pisolithus marmoratus]
MKFVKMSPQLTDAVQCILHIYERSIINSGRLEEVEMCESWRQGVLEILEVLESIRPIANRTDTVPPMLIGVDMYIHWMENMGLDGVLFPEWKKALFPDDNSITGHPWLLTVEHCYDTVGWQLQKPQPMPVQEATTSAMTTPILPPSSVGNVRWTPHMSEVSEKMAEVDEEITKTVHGWSKKQMRQCSQSWMGRRAQNNSESEPEGRPGSETPLTTPKPKYGQAQFTDRTTLPPDPESCGTCVSHKVICTCSAAWPTFVRVKTARVTDHCHTPVNNQCKVQDNVGEAQDEDLINLLGPDVEVDATITSGNEVTTLQGTPPTQSCKANSSTSVTAEESSATIQVTEEQGDAIMEEVH